jgi:exosortase
MNKTNAVRYSILGGLILLIYHSTFFWLYERYMAKDSYYSHGFLIPFITGYLIWLKRDQLKKIKKSGSMLGLAIITISLMMHLLSVLAEVFFISGFSLYFLVFGVSLFLSGKEITKKILFPLGFLIFMFPLPLVAINGITFPMKMLATKIAVFILKFGVNLPMKNEGFHIFFPNASLVVDNPCSGLRSLISMLAMGSIFAYFLRAGTGKKILLFLLAAPVAIATNILRVLMLCLAVYVYGSNMAKELFHDFSGYFIFAVGLALMWYFWIKFQCKVSKKDT